MLLVLLIFSARCSVQASSDPIIILQRTHSVVFLLWAAVRLLGGQRTQWHRQRSSTVVASELGCQVFVAIPAQRLPKLAQN